MENEVKTAGNPGGNIKITLDTQVSDLVDYDKSGTKLFFDSTPGRFLVLPDDTLKSLSKDNQVAYLMAKVSNIEEMKSKASPPTPNFKVRSGFATATRRLKVDIPPELLAKFHFCWKRPEELQDARGIGYEVVPKGMVETFGNKGADADRAAHVVGKEGAEELVLMYIPIEDYKEMERQNKEADDLQRSISTSNAASVITAAGGIPFDPNLRK